MNFIESEDGILVLELEGKLLFEGSHEIKEKAKEYLVDQKVEKLVVDLSCVEFMDSSGVGVLISLFKNLRERGGKMVLAAPTKDVSRVFELTMLGQIIKIFDNIEEAVQSFVGEGKAS